MENETAETAETAVEDTTIDEVSEPVKKKRRRLLPTLIAGLIVIILAVGSGLFVWNKMNSLNGKYYLVATYKGTNYAVDGGDPLEINGADVMLSQATSSKIDVWNNTMTNHGITLKFSHENGVISFSSSDVTKIAVNIGGDGASFEKAEKILGTNISMKFAERDTSVYKKAKSESDFEKAIESDLMAKYLSGELSPSDIAGLQ